MRRWNMPVILSHVVVFVVVIVVLTMGYQPAEDRLPQGSTVNNAVSDQDKAPTVDEVASVTIAATVAQTADYLVANNVAERADSVQVKTSLAQSTDADFLSKPQFVDQGQRRGVTKYTVKQGDSVSSVAASFKLSAQTIKFSNNLTSDTLSASQELLIPAVDGIAYTVKAGDTPDSLAAKYKADKNRIIASNDAELGGLQPGQLIVIPGAVVPANEQPGSRVATTNNTTSTSSSGTTGSFAFGTGPVFGGNGYAYGYCTWHVANRRAASGRPVPNNWGNATTWDEGARAMGMRVDHIPEVGSIMQVDGGWGGYGHVGFVESVNADGSWTISEMNYRGWGVVNSRSFSAGEAASYDFIH